MLLLRVIGVYDIISLLKFRKQIRQLGGSGLSIVIHGDNIISLRMIQSGHLCIVLPGIGRQLYGSHIRIILHEASQRAHSGPAIRTAVIHKDEFHRRTPHLFEFLHGILNNAPDGL